MSERIHARVRGRVQAVGFRDFVRREAGSLGLRGWVRNCDDGSVEVLAEGESEALERLIGRLRQGPSLARVESVEASRAPATGEFQEFAIAPRG